MSDNRKVYEEKLEAQLKEWKAQIELLKAKAANASADAKIEYQETIDSLQRKSDGLKGKLAELKDSGDDAWEEIKTGAAKVWSDVESAFHKAISKFK